MNKPSMDGFRMVCFLGVFLFHENWERFWYCGYSLPAFFVLSGFLITRVLLEGEPRGRGRVLYHFYVRRALRIFPIYYLLLLLLLFAGRLPQARWHFAYLFNFKVYSASRLPFDGALPPGLSYSILHFWSLCVEEQFYLVYPLLLLSVRPSRRPGWLGALLGLSIASRWVLRGTQPQAFVGALPFVCGEYLLWGCLAWAVGPQALRGIHGRWLWLLAVAILLAAGTAGPAAGESTAWVIFRPAARQTLYGFALALLVLGLWRDDDSSVSRALAWGPCAYLGRISYGLYLFHPFAWGAWSRVISIWPTSTAVPAPLARLLLTIGAASIAWRFVEAPLQRLKVRFPLLNSEPASPAEPAPVWSSARGERMAD